MCVSRKEKSINEFQSLPKCLLVSYLSVFLFVYREQQPCIRVVTWVNKNAIHFALSLFGPLYFGHFSLFSLASLYGWSIVEQIKQIHNSLSTIWTIYVDFLFFFSLFFYLFSTEPIRFSLFASWTKVSTSHLQDTYFLLLLRMFVLWSYVTDQQTMFKCTWQIFLLFTFFFLFFFFFLYIDWMVKRDIWSLNFFFFFFFFLNFHQIEQMFTWTVSLLLF